MRALVIMCSALWHYNWFRKKKILKFSFDVDVIDVGALADLVAVVLQQFPNLESVSLKNFSGVIDLDDQKTNVYLVPRYCLENRIFGTFNVQAVSVLN